MHKMSETGTRPAALESDLVTDLYYYRARYYDPSTGRLPHASSYIEVASGEPSASPGLDGIRGTILSVSGLPIPLESRFRPRDKLPRDVISVTVVWVFCRALSESSLFSSVGATSIPQKTRSISGNGTRKIGREGPREGKLPPKIPRRGEELFFSLSSLEPFFCWHGFIHLLSRQENPPHRGGVGHCGFGDADGGLQ